MTDNNVAIVEALVLASPEPITAKKIVEVLDDMTSSKVKDAIEELNSRYSETGCAYRIRNIAGGFQFYIIPEFTGYVEELFTRRRKMRLTRAALEVMAIIAYRQPVTKTDIEHIRGVASDGVIHNLLEKKLITMRGRAVTVGRPLQYGTTDDFLKFFGLNKLEDLPKMSEIEELIKAAEPTNQTELNLLDEISEENSHKLNIADGTYTPEKSEKVNEVNVANEVNDINMDKADDQIEVDKGDELNDTKAEKVEETNESAADLDDSVEDSETEDNAHAGIIIDIDAT